MTLVAIRCPKCRAAMEIIRAEEIEVDRCTQCHGLWFDGRELEKLKKRPGIEAIDDGDAGVGKKFNEIDRIACPRCTTTMVRMVAPDQPHIWFELCSVCGGSYFDAGEFRDYVHRTPLDLLRRLFSPPRR